MPKPWYTLRPISGALLEIANQREVDLHIRDDLLGQLEEVASPTKNVRSIISHIKTLEFLST